MSTRNLEHFFRPRSVALIGASSTVASVGATLLANLVSGGFRGPVWPVNPKYERLLDLPCFPDVAALPGAPDLAVIATPAPTVPALISALGARGTRAVVVISAGFAERDTAEGRALHEAALAAARPWLLRIMGPNTVGLLVPEVGLNASFAHLSPNPGEIAFATQSGALLTSVMDWAHSRGIGFSRLIALGSMADVDFGDILDYLASDDATRAILLYVEAITQPRKFLSAARAAARSKPVIVCKSGRHDAGAKAAHSHTGALAGSDAVYDAAFRRAGMLRVLTLEELFGAVESLATLRPLRGERLAIVTNGGGVGVLATDRLMDVGGHLAELSDATLAKLDEELPSTWSHGNPIDMVGDSTPDRYFRTLDTVLAAPEVDATLVLHVPVSVASPLATAERVVEVYRRHPDATLMTSWIGGRSVAEARSTFVDARVPTFDTPGEAVQAFAHLAEYRRAQRTLLETPPAATEPFAVDLHAARRLVGQALEAGQTFLDAAAARALAAAYGIPVVSLRACRSATAAARAAAQFGGAIALKIWSPDVTHKTDVGGVLLNLEGYDAVLAAARAMRQRVRKQRPEARITGFTVEPMHHAPDGYELIVGASEDRQFGPVILFGHGGVAVEVRGDTAIGLPPLNLALARELIGRTRVSRLLAGFRGLPPADIDGIARVIARVSQLVIDLPEVIELDINPLVASAAGVRALDVRIRVARPTRPGSERLAIRPYPAELEAELTQDGAKGPLRVRPVRAVDGDLLQAADLQGGNFRIGMLRPERLGSLRFAQIDYDRDLVLLLLDPARAGADALLGVAMLNADPDGERGDCGLVIRRDLAEAAGRWLLERILEHAAARGIGTLHTPPAGDAVLARLFDAAGFVAASAAGLVLQLRR
jgi:acetyltransferase